VDGSGFGAVWGWRNPQWTWRRRGEDNRRGPWTWCTVAPASARVQTANPRLAHRAVRGGLWRECGRVDVVLSLVPESSVHVIATRCSPRHE
jgi:hypothetical protein